MSMHYSVFTDYGIVVDEPLMRAILQEYTKYHPDDEEILQELQTESVEEVFRNLFEDNENLFVTGILEGKVYEYGPDGRLNDDAALDINYSEMFIMLLLDKAPSLFGVAPYSCVEDALSEIREKSFDNTGRVKIPASYPLRLAYVEGVRFG